LADRRVRRGDFSSPRLSNGYSKSLATLLPHCSMREWWRFPGHLVLRMIGRPSVLLLSPAAERPPVLLMNLFLCAVPVRRPSPYLFICLGEFARDASLFPPVSKPKSLTDNPSRFFSSVARMRDHLAFEGTLLPLGLWTPRSFLICSESIRAYSTWSFMPIVFEEMKLRMPPHFYTPEVWPLLCYPPHHCPTPCSVVPA